jgi:3-hydroxyisobutyrate dehydrogenase-like beta-hydroxyacid dehydrogenase
LNPQQMYDAMVASGGSSRMLEIRGKWMISGDYPAANNYEILMDKDGSAISDLARSLRHPIPMFANAYQCHMIGLAQGWGDRDASSMAAVYETLSGKTSLAPIATTDVDGSAAGATV